MTPQEQIFISKFVEQAKSTTGINGFEIFDKQAFQRDDGTIGFAREDGSLWNSDKIVETITLNRQNIYLDSAGVIYCADRDTMNQISELANRNMAREQESSAQSAPYSINPESMYISIKNQHLHVQPQMIEALVRIHNEVDFESPYTKEDAENILSECGVRQNNIDAVTKLLSKNDMTMEDLCTQSIPVHIECQGGVLMGPINHFEVKDDRLVIGDDRTVYNLSISPEKAVYFEHGAKTDISLKSFEFSRGTEELYQNQDIEMF